MPWRVGTKVPINVYDSDDRPVCQCQNAAYAETIVKAVNALDGLPAVRSRLRAAKEAAERLFDALTNWEEDLGK